MKKLHKLETVNAENLEKMLVGSIIESVEPSKTGPGFSITTRSFVKSGNYYRTCITIENENNSVKVEYAE
jgi:hypothetical protein